METVYPFRLATASPSTSTSFTAKTVTATEPTGDGVHDLFSTDYGFATVHSVPKSLQLVPFGGNSDNETFDMQVWGWNETYDGSLWVPQLLVQLNVTLTSLSGAALGTNLLMADTIALAKGAQDTSLNSLIVTSSDLGPASMLIHLRGVQKIEFEFDLTGTGDQAGCLWRPVD